MAVEQQDALGQTIMAAAERFCSKNNTGLTTKRLLFEFLALPGPNGKTLSGLTQPGVQKAAGAADVVYITRRWMSIHTIKHYYVMRQFHQSSGVVLEFLQFLSSETSLPSAFAKQLGTAIEVAKEGCAQLPHIMRIVRQPDVVNEAYAFRYPIRPWPRSHVPQTTAVKESSSRSWPANEQQHFDAWVSFACERCRVEADELQEVLDEVPTDLTIKEQTEGCWEVKEVLPDSQIVFHEFQGSRKFTVQFSAKRAADFIPGMVMSATMVTLSNGYTFVTEWGYVYPTFWIPYTTKEEFGPYDNVELVYAKVQQPAAAAAPSSKGTQ